MVTGLKEEFNNSATDRIEGLMTRLRKVPEGQAVVTFLEFNKVEIQLLDNPIHTASSGAMISNCKDGKYYYHSPKIYLKASLTDDNLIQAMIHETEHLNQHLSGVGNPDRILSQEDCILFYRAAEADAQATCTDICWRMKQAGDAGPWNEASNVGYKEICDAYEKLVTADPAALEDGRGRRAAFDAWFERKGGLEYYNHAIINDMIPFLERGREIFSQHNMKPGLLDDSWVDKLDSISNQPYLKLEGQLSLLHADKYRANIEKLPTGPTRPSTPKDEIQPAVSMNPPHAPGF